MNQDLFFQAANAKALRQGRVPDVWSVSQVNSLARQLLEGSVPLLRVAGEVSGFRRYAAGHCYFTLKDESARLDCVMWRDEARSLPTEPPEGLAVQATGQPSVYVKRGRLQFVVRELEAQGEGLWQLAFERARIRLEADGLLAAARKRPPPRHPECVGLVTSPEGAVLRDIVSVIRRRAPWTHIRLHPARVQGDEAASSIARAIGLAGASGSAQVLIVGRGGGSREDLRAFNDERVARAIASSVLPVISAIGHETDVTLADLVADRRAPTPSAAAELAVPDVGQLGAGLTAVRGRLERALGARWRRRHSEIDGLSDRLVGALEQRVAHDRSRLDLVAHRLTALGPMSVLARGYALAIGSDRRILRSVEDFRFPQVFTLRLRDGLIRARAEAAHDEADEP